MTGVEQCTSPEVRRPPEFDLREIEIGRLNSCAQYRDDTNPIQRQLNKSVKGRGLINPLTVAMLTREESEKYATFTNDVWNHQISIEEFVPYEDGGDMYAVMIAGHSRLSALRADASGDQIDPMDYFAHCRVVHEVKNVDDILQWQTEENIHAAPPPQNLAKILAESWLWLQREAKENDSPPPLKKDFVQAHRVGKDQLNDALNYVELPVNIREMTEQGILPYRVSVELGRSVPALTKFAEVHEPENPDVLIEAELLNLTYRYTRSGKVRKACGEIKAVVAAKLESIQEPEPEQQGELEGFLTLVDEETALQRANDELRTLLSNGGTNIKSHQVALHNAVAKRAGAGDLIVDDETFLTLENTARRAIGRKVVDESDISLELVADSTAA